MLQLGDPHFLGERPLGGDRVLLVSTGWRELCPPMWRWGLGPCPTWQRVSKCSKIRCTNTEKVTPSDHVDASAQKRTGTFTSQVPSRFPPNPHFPSPILSRGR